MAVGNHVATAVPEHAPPLLDRVRDKIRVKHYSIRTEQSYVDFIKRFILFHGKRHPDTLGAPEVEAFLTHLAVDGHVSAATQNLAKSAVLFLYREVLDRDLPWLDHVEWAKTPDADAGRADARRGDADPAPAARRPCADRAAALRHRACGSWRASACG